TWTIPDNHRLTGVHGKYAKTVKSASKGGVCFLAQALSPCGDAARAGSVPPMTIAEAARTTSPRRLGALRARIALTRSALAGRGGRYRIATAACRAYFRGTPRGPKAILRGKFVRRIA